MRHPTGGESHIWHSNTWLDGDWWALTFPCSAPIHRKHQHAYRLTKEDHWHENLGAGDFPYCCQQVAQKHDQQVSRTLLVNKSLVNTTLLTPSAFRTREVVIPRFKLEQSYDLIENLEELGLTDMFKESGDFSEMTSEKVSMNWVSLNPSGSALTAGAAVFETPASCSPSAAETPGNHHSERGGDRGCCSDAGGLHAALLSDPLHCGPPLPLPDLWTPYRLPGVHWSGF